MRHILSLMLLILLMPGMSCAGKSTVAEKNVNTSFSESKHRNTSNRILVRFKPGTDAETIKKIQEKFDLAMVKTMDVPDLYLMQITGKKSVETVIEGLKGYDEVLYAEPDYKYRINSK